VRTNPKSGLTASQVPHRGTSRSKRREDALPGVSEQAVSTAIGEQDITAHGENTPSGDQRHISRDEIARLAYFYWEARGGNDGSAEEDWYRAEQELMALSRAVGRG